MTAQFASAPMVRTARADGLYGIASHGRTVVPEPGRGERNRLLAALPDQTYRDLLAQLESVTIASRQLLVAADEPLRYVYFPRDAVVAFLVPMEDGTAAEGAMVGYEGVIGLSVFLGDGNAYEEIVGLLPGRAARMPAGAFRQAVQHSLALQEILHRYTHAFMNQMARTAGCNRMHSVDQRCARLLLMSCDRSGQTSLPITHEFLASTLAVRRASVTEAAGGLQQAGLIEYRRGQMRIRDRAGLEARACEDYRHTRDAYEQLYRSRSQAA